jgi:hypothetical protein
MIYPNKRAMIQDILEKNGYFDWYIAQPDKQNPDTSDAKCVLFNFVEQKRAELVIPNEWFQRYHRIVKLIRLAVQHSTPVATYRSLPFLPSQNSQPKW